MNMLPLDGMEGFFAFHCKLAKGYKYRFWFTYKNERALSSEYDVSSNERKELTNSIDVDLDEQTPVQEMPSLKKLKSYSRKIVP